MRPVDKVVSEIVEALQIRGFAQVPGYKSFHFAKVTPGKVVVLRENGNEAAIPLSKLPKAIEAIRQDPAIYHDGPSRLRQFGLTHITSPLWALLHLLPLHQLQD